MKRFTLALTAAIAASAATSSLAVDIAVGTVLAYDRKAATMILTDRSVWSLTQVTASVPDGLAAGDRVQFSYQSDEDGVADILKINVVRETPLPGARDMAQGTVLAFDRKARLLIFDDKTTWSLDNMQATLPLGLDAGDRVEIDYESDEDGVSVIHDIRILAD